MRAEGAVALSLPLCASNAPAQGQNEPASVAQFASLEWAAQYGVRQLVKADSCAPHELSQTVTGVPRQTSYAVYWLVQFAGASTAATAAQKLAQFPLMVVHLPACAAVQREAQSAGGAPELLPPPELLLEPPPLEPVLVVELEQASARASSHSARVMERRLASKRTS